MPHELADHRVREVAAGAASPALRICWISAVTSRWSVVRMSTTSSWPTSVNSCDDGDDERVAAATAAAHGRGARRAGGDGLAPTPAFPLSPREAAASSTSGVPTSGSPVTSPRHAPVSVAGGLDEGLEPLQVARRLPLHDVEGVAGLLDQPLGLESSARVHACAPPRPLEGHRAGVRRALGRGPGHLAGPGPARAPRRPTAAGHRRSRRPTGACRRSAVTCCTPPMNCGNSSNCVHWLYAVLTGTSTSTDFSTLVISSPLASAATSSRCRSLSRRSGRRRHEPPRTDCQSAGECSPSTTHAAAGRLRPVHRLVGRLQRGLRPSRRDAPAPPRRSAGRRRVLPRPGTGASVAARTRSASARGRLRRPRTETAR